jgi:two-component system nitrogen regulation sensor histidine kinase GlnL
MSSAAKPTATQPSAADFLAAHSEDVLASLGDGLVLVDLDERVTFVSPRAEDLTGVSAAQAVGRTVEHAFAQNPWIGDTVRCLHLGKVRRTSDAGELLAPFGRRVAVQLIAAPILDALGTVVGTLLLFRDLTAQRSFGDAAERGSRAGDLAAVAAGLAHEIKNPLGGIKGAAQLLAEELMRLAAVNVHRVLNEVLTLERAAGDDALTVRLVFDPSLPELMADEAQIRQVFLNLVKNAIEAMARAGTLTVTTRMETDFHVRHAARDRGQFLSVDIEDTGPGIAPEDCARIFAPFFTTKTSGTGLGLAVSERLVTQHGGTIAVDSEPGRGTRVRVRLPVAVAERRE